MTPSIHPDSLSRWLNTYQRAAVIPIRTTQIARKIALELGRFCAFYNEHYGHDRLSSCVRRDVSDWLDSLAGQSYAPSTVNHHLAALSAFFTWLEQNHPDALPNGNPVKGVTTRALPPLEPRALNDKQVRSLKNLCDRLPKYYEKRGRYWRGDTTKARSLRANARPYRDRAIVFVLLSTGIRREELVNLNLDQLEPNTPDDLRRARRATLNGVAGKGKTQRDVFLSADARNALADYLDKERPLDSGGGVGEGGGSGALFLSAVTNPTRSADGRMSPRIINAILEQIGRWHDAEYADPQRHISPLRPHDLRHTFAFRLAQATGADAYELERRLGHRSQRYIQRYTNPPVDVAAGYVEDF